VSKKSVGGEFIWTIVDDRDQTEQKASIKELRRRFCEEASKKLIEVPIEEIVKHSSIQYPIQEIKTELMKKFVLDFNFVDLAYTIELFKQGGVFVSKLYTKGDTPIFPFEAKIRYQGFGSKTDEVEVEIPGFLIRFYFNRDVDEACFHFYIVKPDYEIKTFVKKVVPKIDRKLNTVKYYRMWFYTERAKEIFGKALEYGKVLVLFARPVPMFLCED